MILPLVIIVLILVCAYLEYQKNINMNNKVVICIICILTFVLCMGFVEKSKSRDEGFQNNNVFSDNDLETDKVKAKCKDEKREGVYKIRLSGVKKDKKRMDLLKKYIERLEKGEKVCWTLPTTEESKYIECDNLKNKSEDDLTDDQKKKIKEVCNSETNKKLFGDCIETNMIKNYDATLKETNDAGIKKIATDLSIELKDSNGKAYDKETLINEIIKKEVLRKLLREMRLKDDKYPAKLLKTTEDLIINAKLGLCNDCGLEEDICKKLGDEKDSRAKLEQEKLRKAEADRAAANKAAVDKAAAEKAQKEALAKEKAAVEKAKAEAEELKKKLAQSQEEKVDSTLSNNVSDLLGGNKNENTTLNSSSSSSSSSNSSSSANTTSNQTTNSSYKYASRGNYNPDNKESSLKAREKERDALYLNPISSGHLIDKYYSSLDNKAPGYSYIDPRMWNVPQKRPPVCHYNNDLSAVPLYGSGTHINVLELTQYGDIATSEGDVRQTNVGSILPQFQYNELT